MLAGGAWVLQASMSEAAVRPGVRGPLRSAARPRARAESLPSAGSSGRRGSEPERAAQGGHVEALGERQRRLAVLDALDLGPRRHVEVEAVGDEDELVAVGVVEPRRGARALLQPGDRVLPVRDEVAAEALLAQPLGRRGAAAAQAPAVGAGDVGGLQRRQRLRMAAADEREAFMTFLSQDALRRPERLGDVGDLFRR